MSNLYYSLVFQFYSIFAPFESYNYSDLIELRYFESSSDFRYTFTPDFFLFTSIFILLSYGILIKYSKTKKYPDLKYHFLILTLLILICFFSFYSFFAMDTNYLFNSYFYKNDLSNVTSCYLIFFTILLFLTMYKNLRDLHLDTIEYYVLILSSLFALNMLLTANEIISFFFLIELQSIISYILTGINRRIKNTVQSGIKYFIIGSLSSISVILGFTFIYSVVGSTSFEDIKLVLSSNSSLENNLYLGLFFLTLGLFGKFYIAPFHWWIMDIYEHAPSITTLYFSTVPFFSFYSILYKLYGVVFFQYNSFFVNFFLICCYLSMFIGSIGAVMQRRLKRLIAYSSVTMLGYMLCLLINISNVSYMDGLHLFFFYGICVNGLFCFFFGFFFKQKTSIFHSIEDLHILSVFKANVYSKYIVAFNLYAVLGLPPMPLFFKKLEILLQLAHKDMWFLLFIFVFTSMISAYYYLYIVKLLFYTSLPRTSRNVLVSYKLNNINSYVMVFILLLQIHLMVSFFFV